MPPAKIIKELKQINTSLQDTKTKSFISYTEFSVINKINGGIKMATFTVSVPKEFAEAKKKYPNINWNKVLKQGILKRLEELKKFQKLKEGGKI